MRYYQQKAQEYDGLFTTPLDLAESKAMVQLAGCGNRVLDLGCGTALYLDYCEGIPTYVGVDNSLSMLQEATMKHPHRTQFFLVDMEEPAWFLSCTYDLIVSLSFSMSHCHEHRHIPGEIAQCLGGRAFLVYIGERGFDWSHYWDYLGIPSSEAYRRWTVSQLEQEYRDFDVTVTGFNCFGNQLFRGTKWPESLIRRYLLWEHKTIGTWWPQLGTFYFVELGVKDV